MIATSYWHDVENGLGLYGWRFGGAVAVFIVTIVAARIVSVRVRHGLANTSIGSNPTVLMARLARAGVYFLGLVWILAIFSVPFTALAAVVSVAALALSLSLQDLLKNLIAGIYMLAERPFQIGDRITVSGVTGVIDDIEMRVTHLHTDQGERVIMPNQTVFTQVIVNNTVAGGRTTAFSLSVPRATTAEEIEAAVTSALQGLTGDSPSRPRLQATGVTAEVTSWRLFIWAEERVSAGDVLLRLMKALPSATLDLDTTAPS